MGAAQTHEYVDRRYEDREVNELPDAPVEALRGLGKRGGEALRKALGAKTIRDLATNDFVLKAQEVLRLAEGPAAIPTVVSTKAETTGADAPHQREQAGQEALTRSEEELKVDTRQEEQPEVDKRVVPKERVRIGKEVVRDEEHVSEPVRKEQVEVEQPGGER
jgi:uncharacterized protein (TIGR02271 family)